MSTFLLTPHVILHEDNLHQMVQLVWAWTNYHVHLVRDQPEVHLVKLLQDFKKPNETKRINKKMYRNKETHNNIN